jgi:hypothetical protein
VTLFSPPSAGSGAPRFRPANTRRRIISVVTVIGVFLAIGFSAWAFGVKSDSGKTEACEAPAPTEIVPDRTAVNVYNSTVVTGLATEIADDLKARGFKIGDVGNDPLRRKIRGTGELRYGSAGERQVEALRAWQPGMMLIKDDRRGPVVDFVLGTKFIKLNDVAVPQTAAVAPVC